MRENKLRLKLNGPIIKKNIYELKMYFSSGDDYYYDMIKTFQDKQDLLNYIFLIELVDEWIEKYVSVYGEMPTERDLRSEIEMNNSDWPYGAHHELSYMWPEVNGGFYSLDNYRVNYHNNHGIKFDVSITREP